MLFTLLYFVCACACARAGGWDPIPLVCNPSGLNTQISSLSPLGTVHQHPFSIATVNFPLLYGS